MKSTLRPSVDPMLHVTRALRKLELADAEKVFAPRRLIAVFGHRQYSWSVDAWTAMLVTEPALGALPQYAASGGTLPEPLPAPLRVAVLRRACARQYSDADTAPRAVSALLQYARGKKRGAA